MNFDEYAERNHVDAIAALALQGSAVKKIGEAPFVITSQGLVDLSHLLEEPVRPKGKTSYTEAESFLSYLKNSGTSPSIYCDRDRAAFTAILNDSDCNATGWRDWIAVYQCAQSKEWLRWTGANGKRMSQADFASFIEDNLPDIREPVAADMLEVSRSLQAKKAVAYSSAIRLANGENELQYSESIEASAAKGKLVIPELFKLGIKVFEGDDAYELSARLRYRIGDDRKLQMWFDLIRPETVLRDAIDRVVEVIKKGSDGPLYFGNAGI